MSISTEGYQQRCAVAWSPERALAKATRFVVFDTEATDADARTAQLVSIGAVAVSENTIQLGDVFEMILKVAYNSATVLVHGVTRELAAESGEEEAVALSAFLDYIGDAVLVAHHARFDMNLLGRQMQTHFGHGLLNPAIDTAQLAQRLWDAGVLALPGERPSLSLDALAGFYGITPHDRHTAPGDAFITAQIFLRLRRLAERQGWLTLGELVGDA